MEEDHDHHVQTEFACREAWIRAQAPSVSEVVCLQLAWLYPLEMVPKSNAGIYLDRVAIIPAAIAHCEQDTRVRYVALTWPEGQGKTRVLRLYIDLPTGEAFLSERPFANAAGLLALKPGLPPPVKRGIEAFIRQYGQKVAA